MVRPPESRLAGARQCDIFDPLLFQIRSQLHDLGALVAENEHLAVVLALLLGSLWRLSIVLVRPDLPDPALNIGVLVPARPADKLGLERLREAMQVGGSETCQGGVVGSEVRVQRRGDGGCG